MAIEQTTRSDSALQAAPILGEVATALRQYRDDLRWPPERDSIDRRLAMIDDLLSKLGAIQ